MTGVPLLATASFFMDGGDGEAGIAKGESILIGWYDGAITDRNLRQSGDHDLMDAGDGEVGITMDEGNLIYRLG